MAAEHSTAFEGSAVPPAVAPKPPAGQIRPALRERDPDFIRRSLRFTWPLIAAWFRPDIRGLDRIPARGPVLLVGNHSGGNVAPDTLAFTLAFYRRFGVERPFFQLAHHLVMTAPWLSLLRRYGTIEASPENAQAALEMEAAVLVYPGGDWEAHRPSWHGQPRRVRGARGIRPAGSDRRRADRSGGLDRRPGDGAVPHPRGAHGPRPAARHAVPPQGPAGLGRAALGTRHRRPLRPHRTSGEDHDPGARAHRSTRARFGPSPDVDAIYRTITELMQRTLDDLAAQRRWPVIG